MNNVCKDCKYDRLQCKCSKVVINKPVEVKTGSAGNAGKDAYELAVLEGFEGTLQEWLDSLQGREGDTFAPIRGENIFNR